MKRRQLLQGGGLLGAILLFLLFSYILFPTGRIDAVVTQLLAPQGLTLSPGVRKTLLPGLAWDDLLLSSDQGALFRSDRLRLRPLFLPLFTGRAAVFGRADVGKGKVELEYGFNGREAVNLALDGIDLGDVPFFKSVLGAKSGGIVWSRGNLLRGAKGLSGEFKMEIRRLELSGVRLGTFSLPDVKELRAQGMLTVLEGKARVESLTLEGEGIYMRLSGNLPSGSDVATMPLEMTLEIMPKAEFLEKQRLIFLLMAKFMTSPGVYRVPVRGTLLKPVVI